MSDTNELVTKILEQETSDEMYKIRKLLMLRMALEADVSSSRIPVPLNITELGGYYNLLADLNAKQMQKQMVATALGLPTNYSSEMAQDAIEKFLQSILIDDDK